jgi:hypothetical protein
MQFYGILLLHDLQSVGFWENYQNFKKGQLYSTLGVFGSISGCDGIALEGSIILLIQILLVQQEFYFSLQYYPFVFVRANSLLIS